MSLDAELRIIPHVVAVLARITDAEIQSNRSGPSIEQRSIARADRCPGREESSRTAENESLSSSRDASTETTGACGGYPDVRIRRWELNASHLYSRFIENRCCDAFQNARLQSEQLVMCMQYIFALQP